MSRVINLTNASECALNNPYFKVKLLGEKFFLNWIDWLDIKDVQIFPNTGFSKLLFLGDTINLNDAFVLPRITKQFELTFTDDLLILETLISKGNKTTNLNFFDFIRLDETNVRKSAKQFTLSFIEKIDLSAPLQ